MSFELFWTAVVGGVVTLPLALCLMAEFMNGVTDAHAPAAPAVSSGVLTEREALRLAALGNGIGLFAALALGAQVAKTIGEGIVDISFITLATIDIALTTTILWSLFAAWRGLVVSKTHSLLSALAGMGLACGGLDALLHQGWIKVGVGFASAIVFGFAIAYLACKYIKKRHWHKAATVMRTVLTNESATVMPDDDATNLANEPIQRRWRYIQIGASFLLACAHGGSDGMKYVGIFCLVMAKAGVVTTASAALSWWVVGIFAVVMYLGTMVGGSRIIDRIVHSMNRHEDSDDETEHQEHPAHDGNKKKKRSYKPYMSANGTTVAALLIGTCQTFGLPMSTSHAIIASSNGAKAVSGKMDNQAIIDHLLGWAGTVPVCFGVSYALTRLVLWFSL